MSSDVSVGDGAYAQARPWLNIAEIEINVLSRQCFCRMIGDVATLKQQVAAWESNRNEKQKGMDWKFTTTAARIKLKRLYPKIQN